MSPTLSVVLPAYDEQDNIRAVVEHTLEALPRLVDEYTDSDRQFDVGELEWFLPLIGGRPERG